MRHHATPCSAARRGGNEKHPPAFAATGLLASPIEIPDCFDPRLTGRVFAWQWVRGFSPLLNLYAFVFLFGGAVYSAIQYFAKERGRARFLGNILIAIGALLPGIGGSFARFGYVEVLYITELIGLTFIYFGYNMMRRDPYASFHSKQQNLERPPSRYLRAAFEKSSLYVL